MAKLSDVNLRIKKSSAALALCLALGTLGCDRDEGITVTNAPKEPVPAVNNGQAGGVAESSGSREFTAGNLHGTVPAGWESSGPSRFVNVAYQIDGGATFTVSVLNEQPLAANIQRWEGQVGLPPTPDDQIEKMLKTVETPAGAIRTVDLEGKSPTKGPQRLLGGVLSAGGQMYFFKLIGSPDAVAKQVNGFTETLKSLHSADHGQPAPPSASANSASPLSTPGAGNNTADASLGFTYTLPAGWKQDPAERAMRIATFNTAGNPPADVIVSTIGRNAFSQTEKMNVDRWRGQVKMPAEQQAPATQKISVAGRDGMLWDFAGPDARQIVVAVPEGEQLWFFKIIGPKSVVTDQKAAFDAFVGSIRFPGK